MDAVSAPWAAQGECRADGRGVTVMGRGGGEGKAETCWVSQPTGSLRRVRVLPATAPRVPPPTGPGFREGFLGLLLPTPGPGTPAPGACLPTSPLPVGSCQGRAGAWGAPRGVLFTLHKTGREHLLCRLHGPAPPHPRPGPAVSVSFFNHFSVLWRHNSHAMHFIHLK